MHACIHMSDRHVAYVLDAVIMSDGGISCRLAGWQLGVHVKLHVIVHMQ